MTTVGLIAPDGRMVTAEEEDAEAMIEHSGYKRSEVTPYMADKTPLEINLPKEEVTGEGAGLPLEPPMVGTLSAQGRARRRGPEE